MFYAPGLCNGNVVSAGGKQSLRVSKGCVFKCFRSVAESVFRGKDVSSGLHCAFKDVVMVG